jgi:hypothetical protein
VLIMKMYLVAAYPDTAFQVPASQIGRLRDKDFAVIQPLAIGLVASCVLEQSASLLVAVPSPLLMPISSAGTYA